MVQHANMSGKTVLITGATNGIGKVTALELAKMGAQIVAVGRSREKTSAVVSEIKSQSGNSAVDMLLADLSSMDEVRRLADTFRSKYSRLDVLINNAGAYFSSRQQSVDGLELTFALNHLAYFILTTRLLDMLKDSAPSRIINVSSDAHRGSKMNFDDLQSTKSYTGAGFGVYGQSKLANILFTYELARRLAGTGITVNALHPGFVATGFARNNGFFANLAMGIMHRFALTPEKGAETIIYLASAPEVEGVAGKYFDKCKAVKSSDASYDDAAARRLWQVSEELTQAKASVTG